MSLQNQRLYAAASGRNNISNHYTNSQNIYNSNHYFNNTSNYYGGHHGGGASGGKVLPIGATPSHNGDNNNDDNDDYDNIEEIEREMSRVQFHENNVAYGNSYDQVRYPFDEVNNFNIISISIYLLFIIAFLHF